MAAAECQAHLLMVALAAIDGVTVADDLRVCHEEPEFEVRIEHGIGMDVLLCDADRLIATTVDGYRKTHQLGRQVRS